MSRQVTAIVAGFCLWAAIGGLLILILRLSWPAYEAAHPTRGFTFPMQIVRLVIGAVATLAAGALVRRLAGSVGWAVLGFGMSLLLLSLYDHLTEPTWSRYPLWYHLVYIGYLMPLTIFGARLATQKAE